MSHGNARLTVHGRRLAAERVLAGQRPADVAAQLGCSRTTLYRWVRRWRTQGPVGLCDRPSRPHRSPGATADRLVARVVVLRTRRRMNREAIACATGVPPRTVGRLIARAGLPHLADLDAITGQHIRSGPMSRARYERANGLIDRERILGLSSLLRCRSDHRRGRRTRLGDRVGLDA